MDALEFRLLGPFSATRGQTLLSDGGGRRQALLAVLLLSANRPVSAEALAAAVWGEQPPASAPNLVQGYVSEWRTLLDPGRARRSRDGRLRSTAGGYCLRVGPDECDLLRFSALVRDGRRARETGDLHAARLLLRRAIAERRGPVLVDFDGTSFAVAAAQLEEEWLRAVEMAADVELRLGRPSRALEHVETASEKHPLREPLVALRMLALYRSGRQADALEVYERARATLAEELGVAPGPLLRQRHLEVLRQEPGQPGDAERQRSPYRLPLRLSSFVGREEMLASLLPLLEEHRLVTLTGPPGSGKTRLASETAAAAAGVDEQPVAFVDLSPVRDVGLLWSTVAEALGWPPPMTAAADGVMDLLSARPLLLVLDNLEQLTGAVPEIARMLVAAPPVTVLATAREPLGLAGEQVVPVPPLGLPALTDEPASLRRAPAVRLFVDRARAADPGFTLRNEDLAVIAGICRRLDGLPLALELAAPWTTTLSLPALLERLDRPMRLLDAERSGGDRPDRPARHRTLRAALEWSYRGLAPREQRLLRELAVFVSGAPLEGIEAVSDLGEDTLRVLGRLIDRNLVVRTGAVDRPRYRLLETIRGYAEERLLDDPVLASATQERHTAHVRRTAETVARSARRLGSPGGAVLVERLGLEQAEVRAALDHLAGQGRATEELTIVVDCLSLWWDLGHLGEGRRRLTDVLARAGHEAGDDLLAVGHAAACVVLEAAAEPGHALEHSTRGLALAQRAGAVAVQALTLSLQGNTRAWMDWNGPASEGIALLEQAQALARTAPVAPPRWAWVGRDEVLAFASLTLVDVLRHRDARRARTHAEALLVEHGFLDDPFTASFVLRAVGMLEADRGEWTRGEELLDASLAAASDAASRRSESRSLEELARLGWARGDLTSAAERIASATTLARESGHALNLARCTALSADITLAHGETGHAEDMLGQAETALGRHYPDYALRLLSPRRARAARLAGRGDETARRVEATSALDGADGMAPERVVHLVERAHLAFRQGDIEQTRRWVDVLVRDAGRVGVRLPEPERRLLDELGTAAGVCTT